MGGGEAAPDCWAMRRLLLLLLEDLSGRTAITTAQKMKM
jgi:hypothetical protein